MFVLLRILSLVVERVPTQKSPTLQVRAIGNAPHPGAELPDVESMHRNRASWHKSCRQLYEKSALERAERSHLQGLPPGRKRPRRSNEAVNHNLCLFCGDGTNEADHCFQKFELTKQILNKAVALGEDRIVAILADGDLVAIEGKYHRNCYTGFNHRYDAISKQQDTAKENLEATTEDELLQFIKEDIALRSYNFCIARSDRNDDGEIGTTWNPKEWTAHLLSSRVRATAANS